ncbi:hypothetical protein DAPPUDRAFT_259662 [Daphnia pulex]|uniref:Uncharacterized protein n=1 Tax=Daphnia pulex TaxID=6669 RepID=E9HHL7_DAPPU|nr:hypothetical protein DAPPUDRAFT_259662 [Daphnia pulex]|eukprot:EFX68725.1 hypothetical protein DAPPUDRAFT_259662 [Daphnia pulex]
MKNTLAGTQRWLACSLSMQEVRGSNLDQIMFDFNELKIRCHSSCESSLKPDAIRHVTVLSNQVDCQIEKEHTGRASSVLSCCRLDVIHPVAVLSGQVDNQIIEGNTGRASSVISAADANLFMTVLSNHVDSQIDEDNMAVPVQWSLLRMPFVF